MQSHAEKREKGYHDEAVLYELPRSLASLQVVADQVPNLAYLTALSQHSA